MRLRMPGLAPFVLLAATSCAARAAPSATEARVVRVIDGDTVVVETDDGRGKAMADQWYYARDDDKHGPVTAAQLKELAANGGLTPSDLVWRDGLSEWMPARRIHGLFPAQVGPPPLSSRPAAGNRTAYRTGGAPKSKLNWAPAFVLVATSFGLESALAVAMLGGGDKETVLMLVGLWLPVGVVATIISMILHYRCWEALPPQYSATTPGRAVGLMFVPFYNFYWVFVSYHGLAKGYREYGHSVGDRRIEDVSGLGLVIGIISIASWTLTLIPGASILLGGAALVIYLLYSRATCANANRALVREGRLAEGAA